MIDFASHVWCAEPGALRTLLDTDLSAFGEASQRREDRRYQLVGGIAEIRVVGMLIPGTRSFNYFFFSATGYEWIAAAVRQANADAEVASIVLHIDSPGGVVCGGLEAAVAAIQESDKPVTSYTYGSCLSAAMPIAMAAGVGNVVAAEGAASVGCLGAMSRVVRVESDHYKIIEHKFVSDLTPRKNADIDSKEGKADRQKLVNDLGERFINLVGRLRNQSGTADEIAERFGRGRSVSPPEGLEMGLIDRIETIDLNSEAYHQRGVTAAGENDMTELEKALKRVDDLKAEVTNANSERDQAKGDIDKLTKAAEGAQAKANERIQALEGDVVRLEGERDTAKKGQVVAEGKLEFWGHLQNGDFSADEEGDFLEAYEEQHVNGNDRLMRLAFGRRLGKGGASPLAAGGPADGKAKTHGAKPAPQPAKDPAADFDDRVAALANKTNRSPADLMAEIEIYGNENRCSDEDALKAVEASLT